MMVIFVSQCEKNALKKTRRVLDAFADRIGNNTWQTVITEDGLMTVKKMLKKTASKSTAVSCHWIRTRSRTDLVWVVGRRHAFNHQGVVPVNFTSKEVIMDKIPIETNHLLANTRSQVLSNHLFSVGFVAHQLLDTLHIKNQTLKQSVFIAGVLHDIGKIDPAFQNWVNKKLGKITDNFLPADGVHIDAPSKFSFEKHPRHHELSLMFIEILLKDSSLNTTQRTQIAHAIYWHHTKPFRKEDKFTKPEAIYAVFKKSLVNEKFDDIYRKAIAVLEDVIKLAEKFNFKSLLPDINKSFSLYDNNYPSYKKYDDWSDELIDFQNNVSENSLNNLARSAIISADRLVSGCSSEDLEEYLIEGSLDELVERIFEQEENTFTTEIERCLQDFEIAYPNSTRNQSQRQAAESLADLKKFATINETANIGVLQGPAGCGKTKIALEWALKTGAKKIIWVCPRVQVCLGLFHNLTEKDYLPNSNIEIFTGEYKRISSCGLGFNDALDTDESDYFSGDIVITTIDQVVNSIRSHSHVDTFIQFMGAHVVFDEFHELVNMPAFNLMFAELIDTKKQQGEYANTLLVSATPHYLYLTEFLNLQKEDIVTVDSFNGSSYQIEFMSYDEKEQYTPLVTMPQNGCTFIISNTAFDAQLGYLQHHGQENSVLLHSKYTKQDKSFWFDEVYESFKFNGSQKYEVLRSGPIIQASLNITCDQMWTELTCAENWLQRLGRLDRFGMNSEANIYKTILPKSIEKEGKQTSSCAKFLNQLCLWQSTKAWLNFLQDKLCENSEVSINELYQCYREFYLDPAAQRAIKEDLLRSLKESVKLINKKIIDPISVPPKSKKADDKLVKISANSLRGDNRFVQMAVCRVNNALEFEFIDDYVNNEKFNPTTPQAHLTESIERMRGYGDDNNNLVQYMQKKHHNVKPDIAYKKARNEWELIKEARSPETPIYLSYTPKDLESIGGINAAHKQAIYYVISDKQPIGSMSIDKLKKYLSTTETPE